MEESGLGAGSSWVSHWWLPARPPSVCGAGGLRVGRRRLPAGAAPWERRGRPGKGPARLAGPGRCSGRRAAPGEPWEHRLEERLEEEQAALGAAGFSQCPLLSCGLSSACLTRSGRGPAPWSSVDWGLPCCPPPSALPGSCQPVLTAWGAGSGPQPFERIPGDQHESWWSTRSLICPLSLSLTELVGYREAQRRKFQRVCAVSLGLCGPQGLWFPGGCGPWLREPGCGDALSVSPAPPLTCFGRLPLLLWAPGPLGTGSGAGGSFSSEGAGPESAPALLGSVGESGRGRPPGAWPSTSSAAPGSWPGSP